MKKLKPYLILDSQNQINSIIWLISNFELSTIKNYEVRLLTKTGLNSIYMKLFRLQFIGNFKNKRLTLSPQELASLRIMAHGINLKVRAEAEPYLWLFYNQLFSGDNDKFIQSC